MWRHFVAAAAAIAITLVIMEFWGDFNGAMVQFVKLKAAHDQAQAPMPVAVMSAPAPAHCARNQPCPQLPNQTP